MDPLQEVVRGFGALGVGLDTYLHTRGSPDALPGMLLVTTNPSFDINATGTLGHIMVFLAFVWMVAFPKKLINNLRNMTMAGFGVTGLIMDLYSHMDPFRGRDLSGWTDVILGAGDQHRDFPLISPIAHIMFIGALSLFVALAIYKKCHLINPPPAHCQ